MLVTTLFCVSMVQTLQRLFIQWVGRKHECVRAGERSIGLSDVKSVNFQNHCGRPSTWSNTLWAFSSHWTMDPKKTSPLRESSLKCTNFFLGFLFVFFASTARLSNLSRAVTGITIELGKDHDKQSNEYEATDKLPAVDDITV
jgi:hypothetical protein